MVRSLSDDQHPRVGQRTSSLAPSSPPPSINASAPSLSRPAGVAAASPMYERVHEEPVEEDNALQWPQQQQQRREPPPALPTRAAGRGGLTSAPTLPPRPVAPYSAIYPSAESVSPSSCPPVLSPFATAFDHENDAVAPLMRPSASRSPERPRFRAFGGTGGQAPAGSSSGGGLSSSASYSSLNPSSALSALGRGWQQAKLKDRLGAGVGYAKEWGGKGKGKLQDQWRGLGSGGTGGGAAGRDTHRPTASVSTHGDSSTSAFSSSSSCSTNSFAFSNSSRTLSSFLSPSTTMPDLASSASTPSGSRTSALSPARGAVRLPTVLYSVSVPDRHGVVFGRPLVAVVELTRAPSLPRPSSKDEVTGDDARYWLPGIAFRCLEYLEEWGMREEGVFRVPGRSSHTADLKTMFDAGVGQDRDLREVHPSELDPHAVASVFKSWLRDRVFPSLFRFLPKKTFANSPFFRAVPDPLLSHEIESTVDEMTIHALGYGASSNNFLASKGAAAAAGTPTSSAGGTPASSAPASPNISQGYVEQLRDLMASRMPAEHWHLLRAVM